MHLLEALVKCPLIAILRGITPKEVPAIGTVLVNAGYTCIEVPLNSSVDPLNSIELLANLFQDRAIIGAGTVTHPDQVYEVKRRGGRLIVMPHTDIAIIQAAKEEGLYCIPGFYTPTEAFTAINAGADALKTISLTSIPAILKAFKTVLPTHIPVLPVGGITPTSMSHYIQAGAAGFGLGSSLYAPGDSPDTVAKNAKVFYDTIRELS